MIHDFMLIDDWLAGQSTPSMMRTKFTSLCLASTQTFWGLFDWQEASHNMVQLLLNNIREKGHESNYDRAEQHSSLLMGKDTRHT